MGGVRPRRRLISPLTWRILAVNVTALVVLAAGVVSLVDYRRDLVDAEMGVLHARAEALATALAEGAVDADAAGGPAIMLDAARATLRRLTEATDHRARLFDAEQSVLVDSRTLSGPGGAVTIEGLPPPRAPTADQLGSVLGRFDGLIESVFGGDGEAETTDDAEGIATALDRQVSRWIGIDDGGVPEVHVAVPVIRFDQVAAALLLSRTAYEIDAAVLDARVAVLRLAGVALGMTVLVSLYLSRTIVGPLLRLADAAERVRRDGSPAAGLPDLTGRGDEIGDLAAVLRQMVAALGQRIDVMERFAGDVSHEIKNPLGSIRSAVETASRLDDPAALRTLLAIIEDDVRRLDRLITDIADASRLDVELARTRAEPVDLNRLLATLIEINAPEAAERGVTLSQRPAPPTKPPAPPTKHPAPPAKHPAPPLVVAGIESRLMQVFNNLVANAVSFSPVGGQVVVTAEVDAKADAVEVTVDDDGPGIAEELRERIFERFYSQRSGSEPRGGHSGLGLSIVRQIVEAFDGTVVAENRRDATGGIAGARFRVRLPLHPAVDRPRRTGEAFQHDADPRQLHSS
jgi:two-component system, OmpR family, sensor histidine kinase ChvG